MADTGFSANSEPPELRAPDKAGRRAKTKRLDHVRAPTNAPVEQHWDAGIDRGQDGGQSLDRGRGTVELPASMVRDHKPIDATRYSLPRLERVQDAFQNERPRPNGPKSINVCP